MAGTATPVTGPLSGPTGRRVVAHRAQLQDVLRRNGVTNARLFGSVARGDDRDDSDVDILVDFAPGTTLFDVLRVQDELEAILGVGVDLVASSGLQGTSARAHRAGPDHAVSRHDNDRLDDITAAVVAIRSRTAS